MTYLPNKDRQFILKKKSMFSLLTQLRKYIIIEFVYILHVRDIRVTSGHRNQYTDRQRRQIGGRWTRSSPVAELLTVHYVLIYMSYRLFFTNKYKQKL